MKIEDLEFFKNQLDYYAEESGVTEYDSKIMIVSERQYQALCNIFNVDELPKWIVKNQIVRTINEKAK